MIVYRSQLPLRSAGSCVDAPCQFRYAYNLPLPLSACFISLLLCCFSCLIFICSAVSCFSFYFYSFTKKKKVQQKGANKGGSNRTASLLGVSKFRQIKKTLLRTFITTHQIRCVLHYYPLLASCAFHCVLHYYPLLPSCAFFHLSR